MSSPAFEDRMLKGFTDMPGSWRQDHALQMLAVPTQPHMPERADVIALDVILRSLRELLGQSQAEINMTQTQKWTQRNEHLSAGRGADAQAGQFNVKFEGCTRPQ